MPRKPVHVTIGEIWIDCTVRESHGLSADVTEHPVEAGADVADHVRPRQRSISIDGIISNTPIQVPESHMDGARADNSPITVFGEPSFGDVNAPIVGEVNIPGSGQLAAVAGVVGIQLATPKEFAATMLHFTQEFDRVGAVHLDLEGIILQAKLVTVVTALTIYENVALTDVQIDRDERTGNALRFTAAGRELRIVASDTNVPDPADLRARAPRSRGKQQTAEASPAEAAQVGRVKSALAGVAGL